jgi:AraC-like DNA-binding protein
MFMPPQGTMFTVEANPSSNLLLASRDWEKLAREAEFRPSRMASLCGMSERQLQRLSKQHFGRTPRVWLRELQCRLAKNLIAQGYSSKAAAAELSFATEAHFCREFKKIYGASPQRFAPNQFGLRSESGFAALRLAAECVA